MDVGSVLAERSAGELKRLQMKTVADILEMEGLVELSDELRKNPSASVKLSALAAPDQGSVSEIASRNSDIPRELIERALAFRKTQVLLTVGDLEALVHVDIASKIRLELKDVL